MITVLLADDHALVRRGVRSFLSTQPDLEVVAEAGTGIETVELAAAHRPDVALVDLQMPAMDGAEAIRQLVRVAPSTRVVVLTSHEADSDVFPALRAGALSYLLKDAGPDQLADAVRAATRGEAVLHPRVATRVVGSLRGPRGETPDAFRELTNRELDVLRLLADGLSNTAIADQLVIGNKTVKTHVSAILSKLQLSDRAQAAAYAWRTACSAHRHTTDDAPADPAAGHCPAPSHLRSAADAAPGVESCGKVLVRGLGSSGNAGIA